MRVYETDIFEIKNLHELNSNYVLYDIIGLNSCEDDYDHNIQYIIKELSYSLKHPVTVIHRDGIPLLVVRDDHNVTVKVPSELLVKRQEVVYFIKKGESIAIDFQNYESVKEIVLRFLQFDIQTQLNSLAELWQPSSGDAFFTQNPYKTIGDVAIYNGFFVRAVEIPGGGIGVSIDVTQKYLSSVPLDVHLSRKEFDRLGRSKPHFVHQYGNVKYEFKAFQFSDLTAQTFKFPRREDGVMISLIDDIRSKFGRSMPPEVARLPDNASVLIYKTNTGEERSVIAGLCYQVLDTEDKKVKGIHRKSLLSPFDRRRYIRGAFTKYFGNIKFSTIKLDLNPEPSSVPLKRFKLPDYSFGKGTILTLDRNRKEALVVPMRDLGKTRKKLIIDSGVFTVAEFEPQYFVVPDTVFNMYGNKDHFLAHLINLVDKMHPTEGGWDPHVIVYDDRNKKNSVDVGFEILRQIKDNVTSKKGYALIMLPSSVERIKRQHDELAALVVSECMADHNLTVSIMHSETLEECFYYKKNGETSAYEVKRELLGKYNGYVFGVALNQVLLNNERWPFILNSPLHADITIGIDVKRQIGGFTFVDKFSQNILTRFDKSKNRERLTTSQMIKMLIPNISLLRDNLDYSIRNIVIHRDGRLFRTELDGIKQAIQLLKEKGVLSDDCSVSILEIPKHSISPFRLFEIIDQFDIKAVKKDNGKVLNPQIGSYVVVNPAEAYICTTGREFYHPGTSVPLYVKYAFGTMDFEKLLADLYHLSCLTYTKPDDCSRFPITIKITDRRINTIGSDFDMESLDILKTINI